ncbi:MAG: hypothetical protein V3V96_14410 [Acidiferrobacterales bacterium]
MTTCLSQQDLDRQKFADRVPQVLRCWNLSGKGEVVGDELRLFVMFPFYRCCMSLDVDMTPEDFIDTLEDLVFKKVWEHFGYMLTDEKIKQLRQNACE